MFWISRIHILFFISVCFFCIVLSCADEEHAQVNDSSSSFLLTPDLVLSDLKVPDRGTIGDQITGSVVITNKGPVSASHIFMDVMLVEEEDNNNTIWLGTKGTDMMEAGTRGMIPFSFSVPAGIHEGNYSVLLNVVAYESELFPSDNTICSQKPISLKKKTSWPGEQPDLYLVIQSLSTTNTSAGSPLGISYTIGNTNEDSAGAFQILFVLVPDPEHMSCGYHLRTERILHVTEKMGEQVISTDLIPNTIPPGIYYLVGFVDYTGMIPETNESNNVALYPEPIYISSATELFSDWFADQITGYLYMKTNKYREYLGLLPLTFDSDLRILALQHTDDMIERSYFSHYTPEGIDPTQRAQLLGIDVTKVLSDGSTRTGIAENIIRITAGHTVGKAYTGFVDPTTPEAVADIMMIEWINSPEHNKNLINPTIEKIGIGTRYDGEYFYATQDFF